MNKETGVLNGKIVNESGIPVSEVTVSIKSSPEPVPDIAAISNSNGEFSFGYLKSGNYELRFIKDDLSFVRSVEFDLEQKTVVIKIPD